MTYATSRQYSLGPQSRPFTYPRDDGGIAFVFLDHDLKLALELCLLFRVWRAVLRVGRQARHILDHHQSDLVASLVEKIWLDLDLSITDSNNVRIQTHRLSMERGWLTHMLSNHVKPKVFQDLKVIHHGFPGWGGVQAVRPVPLVERAKQEHEFAIEQRPLHAFDDASGDCSESGITEDFVVSQACGQVVERWRRRRPQLHIFHGEFELGISRARSRPNDVSALIDNGELHRSLLLHRAVYRDRY